MYTQCGTQGYMAPEVFSSPVFDPKKADMFALTVILFIMSVGLPPFKAVTDDYYKLIDQQPQKYKELLDSVVTLDDSFMDFIHKMLRRDVTQRMSLDEMLKHPWFLGKTSTYTEAMLEIESALQ